MRQRSLLGLATYVLGITSCGLVGCAKNQTQASATSDGLAKNPPSEAQKIEPKVLPTRAPRRLTVARIAWEKSFEVALEKAQSSNKPIMIDFYADWCSWCKELDRTTYKAATVINESQNFINVKVNADKRSDLAQRYGVRGLPMIVWTDGEGNKIDSLNSYVPAEPFVIAMRAAYSKFQPYVTA